MNLHEFIKSINIESYAISNILDFSDIFEELNKYNEINPLEFCSDNIIDRLNAKSVMADVKTIITLLLPYELENKYPVDDKVDIGCLVSNNAWQIDYHKQLKEKLSQVGEYLKEDYPGINYKCVVDTSPLIDRRLAYKSGLGSYGKNTFLINDKLGTSFYIGALLINYKLSDFSTSLLEHRSKIDIFTESSICLDCDLCVKYCPGHALTGDYTIDSNKCISYLTQKKAELSYKERELISNRLYGCDICQKVCPYSKHEYEINDEFKRKSSNVIDAAELIKMSNKKLRKHYKDSGFIWRGPNVLKRNAIIVIGNSKKESGFNFLIDNYFELSSEHRLYALWAMCEMDRNRFMSFINDYKERFFDEEIYEIDKLICRNR